METQKMKVVLAYSGGLDTTVAIKWLQEKYEAKVIAACVDVGQAEPLDEHAARAEAAGAKAYVLDANEEFANDYIIPALKANLLYEGVYPAGTALARPPICKKLVELAKKVGATHLAHGCTAKGNDQVRFEACFAQLAPHLKVIAPMREWHASREEEISYAESHGLKVPIKGSPFSIDENLWGRSVECGPLEDPWTEPPEEAFQWTVSPLDAPEEPLVLTLGFQEGVPKSIDGHAMDMISLISKLNLIAAQHGIGRIDHVENRVVGIKSREVYEYPAALVLIKAHKALEAMVLTKGVSGFKPQIEHQLAELVYGGLWFTPLREALSAFIDSTQGVVSGEVAIKLYKGSATVMGSRSPNSLYQQDLSTYGESDGFDHNAANGFLKIYTLPLLLQAKQVSPKTAGYGGPIGTQCKDKALAKGLKSVGK